MPTLTLEFLTEFEQRVKAQPTPSLYTRLAEIDPPLFYRFSSSDRQRILRALAIFEGTGRPLSFWQAQERVRLPYICEVICLHPPRALLKHQIQKRFQAMLKAGVV